MDGVVWVAIAFVLVVALVCASLVFPGWLRGGCRRWPWRGRRRTSVTADGWQWARRGLLVAALVLLPALLILALRRQVVLDDFQADDYADSRSAISQLLRGERLVPPPPPPPAVFSTEQVRREHPEVELADRRWAQIQVPLRQRVLAIYAVMRRQYGYEMVLQEGYRSPERQAALMAAGQATRAGAWQSCHQYGLAVDSVLIRDGRLQWDRSDPDTRRAYQLYGALAREAGLGWGGDWQSLKDYVHVELSAACREARRQRGRS